MREWDKQRDMERRIYADCLDVARCYGLDLLGLDENAVTEVVGEIAFEALRGKGLDRESAFDSYLPYAWEAFYQAQHEVEKRQ